MCFRWRRVRQFAAIVLLCAIPSLAQRPSVHTQSKTQPAASVVASARLFEFHSGFWINLHHFLYLAAFTRVSSEGPRRTPSMSEADISALTSLHPDEQQSWLRAINYYAESMVHRDLLFDRNMQSIKNALEDAESSTDLANVAIPAELRTTLLDVAAVYRAHWWARHDAQNRKWIDTVRPLVDEYGAGLRDALVKIYDEPWPGQPVRVDVTVYGGRFGAYTTIQPTRVTISSTSPGNAGNASLEVLFHETSHGMMDKVIAAARSSEARMNPGASSRTGDRRQHLHAETTENIWHAVLFYTIGELVAERIHGYTPYAEANGLWSLVWPAPDRKLIEQDWKPHMQGEVSIDDAIYSLVRDWHEAARKREAAE
jgi:hypothetical protein